MADPYVATFMAKLEVLFEEQRDPARAPAMAAYMRDQFAFYGIPAPAQRAAAREAAAGLAPPTEADLASLAGACWARPQREWQYAACDALARGATRCSAALLDTVEHLIVTKSWWDTVDSLAAQTTGALVTAHPQLAATMDAWIEADNFWLARTAILHQLKYKAATDAARLFGYCERRAADREFFIRKAIGWALREYSKTDPAAVQRFVADHDARLSGLSKREALRRMAPAAS